MEISFHAFASRWIHLLLLAHRGAGGRKFTNSNDTSCLELFRSFTHDSMMAGDFLATLCGSC